MQIQNEWCNLEEWMPESIQGIRYELNHIPTNTKVVSKSFPRIPSRKDRLDLNDGRIDNGYQYGEKIYWKLFPELGDKVVSQHQKEWGDRKPYTSTHWYIPAKDIEIRFHQKDVDKLNNVLENIRIGDFVKCSGSRGGDYRKITHIDWKYYQVDGIASSGVYDDYLRYSVSSRNGMSTIKEIWRNGEQIL